MVTTGIILSFEEAEEILNKGYLLDLQLLDDNGGFPYGTCAIVLESEFKPGDIDALGLSERIENVYVSDLFDDKYAAINYTSDWYGKGCTGKAYFASCFDYLFLCNEVENK